MSVPDALSPALPPDEPMLLPEAALERPGQGRRVGAEGKLLGHGGRVQLGGILGLQLENLVLVDAPLLLLPGGQAVLERLVHQRVELVALLLYLLPRILQPAALWLGKTPNRQGLTGREARATPAPSAPSLLSVTRPLCSPSSSLSYWDGGNSFFVSSRRSIDSVIYGPAKAANKGREGGKATGARHTSTVPSSSAATVTRRDGPAPMVFFAILMPLSKAAYK